MKKLLTFALVFVFGFCYAQNRFQKEFEKADKEFEKASSERIKLLLEVKNEFDWGQIANVSANTCDEYFANQISSLTKFESRLLDEKLIKEAQLNAIAVIHKRKVKIRLLKFPK